MLGGTIVEVGERIRKVKVYNDPGPSEGNEVEHDEAFVDIWESLKRQYNEFFHSNGTSDSNGGNGDR
jgi:hypothetical protein